MVSLISTVLAFIIALIISAVIIYVVTRFFGEKEDLQTALTAALIGTVIYTGAYYMLGQGLIAAILAGIAWLLSLRILYKIGWLRALIIAVIIWFLASIVGWFLPTLTGPI
jgi:hypothetical protein